MKGITDKKVTLIHHKTSEKKDFVLRPFCNSDVEAVIQCVREEYDDTYYRREYYDRRRLLDMTQNGDLYLFLACDGDEVCGIQSIISHAPKETRLEAASQIFRRKYRGYGLPYELVKYTYDVAKSLAPSCIYASTVVFHNITQSMCEDAGMVPVAFNLGSHITSKMHNSYRLGDSDKYAQAILVLPVAKKDAGTIYIHPDIEDTVRSLYRKLGVKADIICTYQEDDSTPQETCDIEVSVNEREQSVSLKASAVGDDLIKKVRDITSGYSKDLWTIQLIIPVDTAYSIPAYEALTKEGFFFAGIRPVCCDKEQIFMQHIGNVHFDFEDFVLTDGFRELLLDIRSRI